jgi:hypothetical protein
MAAKVRRNRRVFLRVIEVARLRARDGRYPRSGLARWKARRADEGRAPLPTISANSVDSEALNGY